MKSSPATTGEAGLLPILRANKLGIPFVNTVTFDQWSEVGGALARADSALMWCLGDWLNYGAAKAKEWGERYVKAVAASGYDYQTCRNAAWVAGAIGMSRRRDTLSFGHHAEVAALDGAGKAGFEYWLALADKHGLSVRELRASVKHGKVMRIADLQALAEEGKGMFTPQGVLTAFRRSFAEARRLRDVDEWSPRQRAVWREQLKPIVELYERLG